jgi:ketosteroid isomerase-like protein
VSQENVEIVRHFNAPYDGENVLPRIREALDRYGPDPDRARVLAVWADDPAWRFAHPDLEWDTSATGFGTAGRGPREVALFWADWVEGWTRYLYRVQGYRDLGEWVLTVSDVQATARDGLELNMQSVQLWQVREGKVAVMRAFLTEAEALEVVGLEE